MKVETFKNLIKEAVKEALKEILVTEQKEIKTSPVNIQVNSTAPPQASVITSPHTIQSILDETRKQMSAQDYSNIIGESSPLAEGISTSQNFHQPGLDLSNLDFVKRASQVLKLSNEKANR